MSEETGFDQDPLDPDEAEPIEQPKAAADPARWVGPAAIAGSAVVLAIALAPAWLSRQMPVRGDALSYFWPLRRAMVRALDSGALPYYSTLNDGGTPLWLNPQYQALYPPTRLLTWLPAAEAMAVSHAFHLGLVFLGVILVLSRLGYRGAPAAFGALATALGGTFLSLSAMQDKLCSAAWLPLLLWGILTMRQGGALPRLVVLTATAMAVLAGGLDIVIIGVVLGLAVAGTGLSGADTSKWEPEEEVTSEEEDDLATLAFEGLPVGVNWDDDPDNEEDEPPQAEETESPDHLARLLTTLRFIGPDILRTGGWIAAGLAITATQWLPFRLWLGTTTWADGIDPSELASRALRFPDVLGLFAANVSFLAAEGIYRPPGAEEALPFYLPGLYVGGAGLVLAGAGILGAIRRPGPGRWALIYTALSTLLAFGPALPPVGWLLSHLPLFSSIRYPEKWLIPAALGGAVLIAEGARMVKDRDTRADVVIGVLWGLFVVGLILGMISLGLDAEGDSRRVVERMAIALLSGSTAVLVWQATNPERLGWAAVATVLVAIGILGVDLAHYNRPLAPLVDPAEISEAPVAIQTIVKDTRRRSRMSAGSERMHARIFQASYALRPEDPVSRKNAPLHQVVREALLGGIAATWNVEVMRDWLVMPPRGLESRFEALMKLPLPRQVDGLRLAGVTHIVVHFRDDALELSPRMGRGLEALQTPEGTWTNVAVFAIEKPLPACRWTPRDKPESDGLPVTVESDDGGRWTGRVTSSRPGMLVCVRPFEPAWEARVDGQKTEVELVNDYQLGVPIPAGAHEVKLEYRPRGLRLAKAISLGGLTISLFSLGLGGIFRWRRRGSEGDSDAELASDESAEFSDSELDDAYPPQDG